MGSFSLRLVSDTVTPKLIKATALMQQGIVDGLETAGQDMENTATQIVPVDTGYLQSTIYHAVDPSILTLELGASADYAAYVELGTRRMAAQPYIRPAFAAGQEALVQALALGVLSAFQ